MLIFQVDESYDDMSKEEYERWQSYLEEQCEKDGMILLPPYINLLKTSQYNQETDDEDEGEDEDYEES